MQSFTGSRLALREKLDAAGYSDLSWGTKKPWSPVKILFFRGIAIQAREAARERLGRDTSLLRPAFAWIRTAVVDTTGFDDVESAACALLSDATAFDALREADAALGVVKLRRHVSLIARGAPITVAQNNKKWGKQFDKYENYKAATTARQYIALGGSLTDLIFDLNRGYVRVLDVSTATAPAAPHADLGDPRRFLRGIISPSTMHAVNRALEQDQGHVPAPAPRVAPAPIAPPALAPAPRPAPPAPADDEADLVCRPRPPKPQAAAPAPVASPPVSERDASCAALEAELVVLRRKRAALLVCVPKKAPKRRKTPAAAPAPVAPPALAPAPREQAAALTQQEAAAAAFAQREVDDLPGGAAWLAREGVAAATGGRGRGRGVGATGGRGRRGVGSGCRGVASAQCFWMGRSGAGDIVHGYERRGVLRLHFLWVSSFLGGAWAWSFAMSSRRLS